MGVNEIKSNFSTEISKLNSNEDQIKIAIKEKEEIKEFKLHLPNQENLTSEIRNIDGKRIDIKKENKKISHENEEDPYDLDLQIKDLVSKNLPSNMPQSDWSRCSCHCQTQRGHTCGGCDTQQNMYTCVRC